MGQVALKPYRFIEVLKQQPRIKRVYLFGSRARGDYTDRSDIDLAIDCPEATPHEWQELLNIIDEADTLLEIDCVRFDKLPDDHFKARILQEGKRLK